MPPPAHARCVGRATTHLVVAFVARIVDVAAERALDVVDVSLPRHRAVLAGEGVGAREFAVARAGPAVRVGGVVAAEPRGEAELRRQPRQPRRDVLLDRAEANDVGPGDEDEAIDRRRHERADIADVDQP